MPSAVPHVAASAPAGFGAAAIAPPPIAANAGAQITQWDATSSGSAALVVGCVATPVPGWVDDMRPAVEGRTVALAGKAASAITGFPMDARAVDRGFELRAASRLDGPVVGVARTFIGFDHSRVFTCFAVCATGKDAATYASCATAVAEAALADSLAPPPPGLGLRAVTWGVHHPREAAAGGGGFVTMAAVMAILFRRRPRFAG